MTATEALDLLCSTLDSVTLVHRPPLQPQGLTCADRVLLQQAAKVLRERITQNIIKGNQDAEPTIDTV